MNIDEKESVIEQTAEDVNASEASEFVVLPKTKKKKRILLIVLAAVVVVIGALSVGGLLWHNDPSFCNAICHSPMDPYVQGFYSGDQSLLVSAHMENGEACLTCHEPTLGEQIDELGVWLKDNFSEPLKMKNLGTKEFCLRCHDFDDAFASTVEYGGTKRNPHEPHGSEGLECYECHRVHSSSVMYCNYCHRDVPTPEGWVKP